MFHSSKVRRLVLGSEIECEEKDLRYLSVYMPNSPLFLNLKEIVWNGCPLPADYSHLFLSPPVTSAPLLRTSNEPQTIVQSLAYRASGLQNLVLYGVYDKYFICNALERAHSKFTNLVNFSCDFKVTNGAFRALSVMPCLASLTCHTSYYVFPEMIGWEETRSFPALEELSLQFDQLNDSLLALLDKMMASPLKKSHFDICDENISIPITFSFLHSLLSVVAKFPDIREVQIKLPPHTFEEEDKGTGDSIIDDSVLRPLMKLPLQVLVMDNAPFFDLSDRSLEAIGSAFPDLRCLELGNAMEEGPCNVTYHGLKALTARCPRLVRLGVRLDLNKSTLHESQGGYYGTSPSARTLQDCVHPRHHLPPSYLQVFLRTFRALPERDACSKPGMTEKGIRGPSSDPAHEINQNNYLD